MNVFLETLRNVAFLNFMISYCTEGQRGKDRAL
jgi:hypothetical protein